MALFGIPPCPYCRKRANIINLWRIKKHGEYRCPRCNGISNIYLSPLVYVFAVLAVGAGFMLYFSERFIFDNLSFTTPIKVLIPFVAFFVLSIFTVTFKKPVIKKFKKTPDGRYFDTNGKEYVMRLGKLIPVGNRKMKTNNMKHNEREEFGSEFEAFDEPEDYPDNNYSDVMDISTEESFNRSVKTYNNEIQEDDWESKTMQSPILPYDEREDASPLLDFDEEEMKRRESKKTQKSDDDEFDFLNKL